MVMTIIVDRLGLAESGSISDAHDVSQAVSVNIAGREGNGVPDRDARWGG